MANHNWTKFTTNIEREVEKTLRNLPESELNKYHLTRQLTGKRVWLKPEKNAVKPVHKKTILCVGNLSQIRLSLKTILAWMEGSCFIKLINCTQTNDNVPGRRNTRVSDDVIRDSFKAGIFAPPMLFDAPPEEFVDKP